jgi:hypothetical protein
MSKIRTVVDLSEVLDKEMAWRKKELITLKLLHDQARDHQAIMLRRAGVSLLYAHWEGFVKHAGTAYVEFVARQGLRYRDLGASFVGLGMKAAILQAQATGRGRVLTEIAGFFIHKQDDHADLSWKAAVQTKSNLSSERLRDVVAVLGLDYAPFELREKPVIDRLLEQRNQVAHGQFLEVDAGEFAQLHGEVLIMLEEIRTQIDNAAATSAFRR